jgi:hypothetical protein
VNTEERQHALRKINRYVSGRKENPELSAAVEKYAAGLDDEQLLGMVRVTGTAASTNDAIHMVRDWIKDDRDGVLKTLIDNPTMQLTAQEYDHATSMFVIMRNFGHPPVNTSLHWKAHLKALMNYDGFDMTDFWTYSRNKTLMELVDAHPEDVDAIMRLRNQFKLRVVTEEILTEYKATHSALNDGLL